MQLELCETIESYMKDLKNVNEDFHWKVLVDILLAVKALHDRDLIHLDIKLDNILIDEDNVCKLSDFGLVINEKKVSFIFRKVQRTDASQLNYSGHCIRSEFIRNISNHFDFQSLNIVRLQLYLFIPSRNGEMQLRAIVDTLHRNC